jgi:hypothetical protein
MIHTLIYILILTRPVTAEIDHLRAISDGFVHAAVVDVLKEPIENAITPNIDSYYVCTETSQDWLTTPQEKCYTDILDYNIIIPPNSTVVLLVNIILILFLISFVVWCFVSPWEEKNDIVVYIICHMIGRIIYDMLCSDDD